MRTRDLPLDTLADKSYDLICFSHLRWDFVYQRPQHLMSRAAKERNVYFIEEPIFQDGETNLIVSQREDNLKVVVPHLSNSMDKRAVDSTMQELIERFVAENVPARFVSWYYTPLMLGWTENREAAGIVYDCMDELSMFKNAPPELCIKEAELLAMADLVFTGGRSLYESKRELHPDVYCFPSSIDKEHFGQARTITSETPDQEGIPSPRIGFFGVIDERTDIELLDKLAQLRPAYQFVMIGPVVKIDEADLPRRENIHYLGGKSYNELPAYIAGWNVAMMPFAMNDSTKFISPTKTPEYLAAGRPVVSTPIRDVVRPYGEAGLVRIGQSPEAFAVALDEALNEDLSGHWERTDEFLENMSWDNTYYSMFELIDSVPGLTVEIGSAAAV